MAVDHPHGGGEANLSPLEILKRQACKLSLLDPGNAYIVMRSKEKDSLTNDLNSMSDSDKLLDYYVSGHRVEKKLFSLV